MTDVQENHDASSGDTVVSQNPSEKTPPLPAHETEHNMAGQYDDEDNGGNNGEGNGEENGEENGGDNGEENGEENGDQIEKQQSGAPLDRTPSQAQRMGKKKIIVVMGALCVRVLGWNGVKMES